MRRLTLVSTLVAAFTLIPLVYIAVRALGADAGVWERLWVGQLPGLLSSTLALLLSAVGLSTLLGVGCAWLVERTDLPGRAVWRWLLALPLAVPAYVAAACWLIVFRRGGLLETVYRQWTDAPLGSLPLPNLYSLPGAALIISLCVFPYVYLPAAAALRSINRSLEEAARVAGRSAWGAFREVTLPLILPAVAAGALLVGLYVLSDFGTVVLLQYRTFTVSIYRQFAGQTDRAAASILSLLLIGLTLPLVFGELRLNRRERRLNVSQTRRPPEVLRLNGWRWPALGTVTLVAGFALLFPFAVLSGQTLQGLLFPTEADRIWSVGNEGVWVHGRNSVLVAGAAATLALALSLAPVYLDARFPSRWTRLLLTACKMPYALPGLIVGLSFVMFLNQWVNFLYGTVAALILAFTFRLMPQALATNEAVLRSVPPSLEQAARTLGQTGWGAFRRVILPVAAPGVIASWALAFIAAMKELPTAILLRPPGFDTLPVSIWSAADERVYTQAAPPALLLILFTLIPLAWVYSRQRTLIRDLPE